MKASAVDCYIGLGSNLHEPEVQVRRALVAIGNIEHTKVIRQSSLYGSPPMGPQDQGNYVNAAVWVQTWLEPIRLLRALKGIEKDFGRDLSVARWGPRIIDLDILLFGSEQHETAELHIPHPGLLERAFVVRPLLELNPSVTLPGGALVAERCGSFAADATWVIEPPPIPAEAAGKH